MDPKGIFISLVMLFSSPSFGWARVIFDNNFDDASTSNVVLDVVDYGAVGDGKTDDSNAILKAWTKACGTDGYSGLRIPAGKTFLVNPMTFQGPCKSTTFNIQMFGNIVAPDISAWGDGDKNLWIKLDSINGLTFNGSGTIDGRGSSWWKCRNEHKCSTAPTGLFINNCNDLRLNGINFVNSPMMHIILNGCDEVEISKITITAPEDSPNTDGIHLGNSKNIKIEDSVIGTGDDCVSIGNSSSEITISRILCGPGHGISVGSLGAYESVAAVENVNVNNCTFRGTMNGVRVKTWQGGSGYARGIKFENIILDSVDNAIMIDQYYCNGDHNCANKTSAVKVSQVTFIGVHGTSTKEVPINLLCSETVGCTNIVMGNIEVNSTKKGEETVSKCINAHGNSVGLVSPHVPCLA